MKSDNTSLGLVVFLGVVVALGIYVAFNTYVFPHIYMNIWLLHSAEVFCPALGGVIAGWFYRNNSRLYLRNGFVAGALTGFTVAAMAAIVFTVFWTSTPTHQALFRYAGFWALAGTLVILAGGAGGLLGSSLGHTIGQSSPVHADNACEESVSAKSFYRTYGPVFAVVAIVSCVFWGYTWLSVPDEIPNELWGLKIGMNKQEVSHLKGEPDTIDGTDYWQYQKRDGADYLYSVLFADGQVVRISVYRESRYPITWGRVASFFNERNLKSVLGGPTHIEISQDESKKIWVYKRHHAFFIISMRDPMFSFSDPKHAGMESIESMHLYDPKKVKPDFSH